MPTPPKRPSPPSAEPPGRVRESVVVPLLLAAFVLCGFLSLRRESATFDETTHLPAGVTHLDRFDFRHNPEHPPLAKMWGALPVWLAGIRVPDYGSPHWVGVQADPSDAKRSRANQWAFGFEMLNGRLQDAARLDPTEALVPARTAMLLLGVALGLLVWAWARELWGPRGGVIALLLYVLSPAVLAHTRLVTTDVASALGFVGAIWCFRRFLRRPSSGRVAALGVALGGALLAKFSTLLLVPMFGVLLAWWWARPEPGEDGASRRASAVLAGLAAAALIGWGVVWAGYGFRFSAVTDPGYRLEWEAVRPTNGTMAGAVLWARDHRLLPEAYLYGLGLAGRFSQARLAFFHGRESLVGWWYFFPAAFLLKTPLAFLALVGWAAASRLRAARRIGFEGACIAVPVIVYFASSIASHLNIGHRHLLPVYPFLCIAGGAATFLFEAGRRRAIAAGVLLAGCAVSFAAATPGYLGYFNLLAGGSKGGWRWLVDSNIDWGQDLPALARWMRTNGVGTVHLAYFGTADPRAYGIDYRKVVLVNDFRPSEPAVRPGAGDWLAVSVTLLQGLYVDRDGPVAEALLRSGAIDREVTRRYRAFRDEALGRGEGTPPFREWVVATGTVTPEQRRAAEEGTLAQFFDQVRETMTPVARAGDSILIYRFP